MSAALPSDPEDAHRPPRLLAIDASELIHQVLRSALAEEGIEVHGATTGDRGLALARTTDPDVILLDLSPPGAEGFAVLSELKSDPATHDIPVIAVCNGATTDSKVRGLEMGAADVIAKPLDPLELRARVRATSRLGRMIKMLAERARLDGLTGLWNRAYLEGRLVEEIASAQRHGTSLALVFCDIDYFKSVNDRYGHPFGDRVLEEFARLLDHGRAGDVPARYGGEEFVVILPRTGAEEAAALADRLRRAVRCRRWNGREDLVVTASFGVSDLQRALRPAADALLESADRALYEAKQAGRDRVAVAPHPGEFRERSA